MLRGGEGVYSQEQETASQEVRRLAMADFEADVSSWVGEGGGCCDVECGAAGFGIRMFMRI